MDDRAQSAAARRNKCQRRGYHAKISRKPEIVKSLYGVYGASGCGRGIMPLLRHQLKADVPAVFIDDNMCASDINGHQFWTFARFSEASAAEKHVVFAIPDPLVLRWIDAR